MQIATVVPDGKHEGVISNVSDRTTQKNEDEFTYINIEVTASVKSEDGDRDIKINASAPARLTKTPDGEPSSKLAKMLVGLGYDLATLKSVSPDSLLKDLLGAKVSFLTMTKLNESGSFAEIVDGSLSKI